MKKMGKTFIIGTALAAAAAVLSSCDIFPQPNVYGPPPSDLETTVQTGTIDPATEINEDVYGPPVIDDVAEAETK